MMKFRAMMVVGTCLMTALPTAALAQDEDSSEEASATWEIDAEVGVLSDYRFRGISLSGKDPEVTAEISVAHESGFYGSAWASNVDLGNGSDDLEVDLSAGWSGEMGPVTTDIGAVYYLYPGISGLSYIEFYGSLSTAVGPGEVTAGINYAPSQTNIGNLDNVYYYVSGEVPLGETPLSLHASFGIEDGAFGDSKRDWTIGVAYDIGSGVTAAVDYVDTHRAAAGTGDATAVASLKFAF